MEICSTTFLYHAASLTATLASEREGQARAQRPQGPGRPPLYGASTSFFLPASARTRAVFGSQWQGFGPGLSPVYGDRFWRLRPDVLVLQQEQGPNEALIVGLGGQFRRSFRSPVRVDREEDGGIRLRWRTFAPWYSVGLRAQYVELRSPASGVNERLLSYGFTASLGTSLGRNAYVACLVLLTPDVGGFPLNGTILEFGLRF